MQAIVGTVQVQTGKMDEVIRIVRDSFVPAARQQQKLKGALVLTAPDTGKVINVTLWDTEADMTAGESIGFLREQFEKIVHLMAGPPVREVFEVSVQV